MVREAPGGDLAPLPVLADETPEPDRRLRQARGSPKSARAGAEVASPSAKVPAAKTDFFIFQVP